VANDANGWDELIAKFRDANVDVVALEATASHRWLRARPGVRS